MRPRTLTAAIAVLALAATGAPSVTAGGDAKTRIEITKLTPTLIKGTIESGKSSCKKGREVQVFRMEGFVSHKVVRGNAQPDGDWKFKKDLKPAAYFAQVDSKPGCRYDVSPQKTLRD